MSELSITKAIDSGGDARFKAIETFDGYFSWSGRKYRVIGPAVGQAGFAVQPIQTKRSWPLLILKALSYATIVLPIIMAVGKLIARSRYAFHLAGSQPATAQPATTVPAATPAPSAVPAAAPAPAVSAPAASAPPPVAPAAPPAPKQPAAAAAPPAPSLPQPKKGGPVQAADPHQLARARQQYRTFKEAALQSFSQPQQQAAVDFSLSAAQQDSLSAAYKTCHSGSRPAGVTVIRGGINTVLLLDEIPDFVFKPMRNRAEAQDYLDTVDRARQVVDDHDLFLLHVPAAAIKEVDGQLYIMQQKAQLHGGSHNYQKGLYQTCWEDGDMEEYIQSVFKQMTLFIALTGFSDVKYDNMPLDSEGRVALFDLDDKSALLGLCGGTPASDQGLFKMLPSDRIDELLAYAHDQLDANLYRQLASAADGIRQRALRREDKLKQYRRHLNDLGVVTVGQQLNAAPPRLFADTRQQQAADAVVRSINARLAQADNLSVAQGRKLKLPINIGDPLAQDIMAIWKGAGSALPYITLGGGDSFKTELSKVLDGLIDAGIIHSYAKYRNYPFVKVAC